MLFLRSVRRSREDSLGQPLRAPMQGAAMPIPGSRPEMTRGGAGEAGDPGFRRGRLCLIRREGDADDGRNGAGDHEQHHARHDGRDGVDEDDGAEDGEAHGPRVAEVFKNTGEARVLARRAQPSARAGQC